MKYASVSKRRRLLKTGLCELPWLLMKSKRFSKDNILLSKNRKKGNKCFKIGRLFNNTLTLIIMQNNTSNLLLATMLFCKLKSVYYCAYHSRNEFKTSCCTLQDDGSTRNNDCNVVVRQIERKWFRNLYFALWQALKHIIGTSSITRAQVKWSSICFGYWVAT